MTDRPRRHFPDRQLAAFRYADPVRHLVVKASGGSASVYQCPFCRHSEIIRRMPAGRGVGRGFGLRTGGAAHSRVSAHIRAEHADIVEAIRANAAELKAAGVDLPQMPRALGGRRR